MLKSISLSFCSFVMTCFVSEATQLFKSPARVSTVNISELAEHMHQTLLLTAYATVITVHGK